MKEFNVVQLDDEYCIVRDYKYQPPEKITVTITETDACGNTTLVKEWQETRKPEKKELCDEVYIFNKRQLEVIQRNYELGSCPITTKGLCRYSLAWGSRDNWYGQPARTAKALLKKGVPVPKELYGLFLHVRGAA